MSDDKILEVLIDIRNWIRAASHGSVKTSLEAALPEIKTRAAYQMFDGTVSAEQVRIKCKMSPNAVVALTQQWVSMALMEITPENRRRRLFDLRDFALLSTEIQKEATKGKK
jgi:hypothetical protein